ncbi:hypothetical protein N658DRAFT_465544 [Parathielavia hyrcaniae]|uniref:Uncharacterized protein n=1 Tax=Parathielavia hyrcaniae TaxID=113614 RepID=A0AAN6Q5C4_9PEZI|nr:hypothetical protein N658DRAFT_465544 [Parathielavia hyrcaniae]
MLRLSTEIALGLSVLIATLCLNNHYHGFPPGHSFRAIMSTSPEPEQQFMSLDEYITLCADLHNTLLTKSVYSDSPPPETSTDLIQRYESYRANPPYNDHPNAPSLDLLSPLATLLSRLRTTIRSPAANPIPLTPLLYQPMPEWFFPPLFENDFNTASSPFLLLYPQRDPFESHSDGGLFVDIYTLCGIWRRADSGSPLPPPEDWLPLDSLLKLELSRWESGRYVNDSTAEDGLKVEKWVPVPFTVPAYYPNLQVAEAISEWERLLSAIESKMPPPTPGVTSDRQRGEPLRHEAMEGLRLSHFAEQFLGLARRPKGWTFVAPGIGTFSEESLREAYSVEREDAFRRTFTNPEGGEDWVTLLIPNVVVESVPADVSHVPDFDISSFDKPYGFGKVTVGRRPGLYTTFAEEQDGDLVQLVCPSGRTNAGVFSGLCPWGPSRPPRLAEMLGHWANLVENEVWAVNDDGVKEDAGWFDSYMELANLNWDDISW